MLFYPLVMPLAACRGRHSQPGIIGNSPDDCVINCASIFVTQTAEDTFANRDIHIGRIQPLHSF
jgi:hypothetical protein